MATTKNIKRTFASELQSLPVQLVPPDPMFPASRQKQAARAGAALQPEQTELEPDVLNRLILKIKHI
jgi:hypothetical protein